MTASTKLLISCALLLFVGRPLAQTAEAPKADLFEKRAESSGKHKISLKGVNKIEFKVVGPSVRCPPTTTYSVYENHVSVETSYPEGGCSEEFPPESNTYAIHRRRIKSLLKAIRKYEITDECSPPDQSTCGCTGGSSYNLRLYNDIEDTPTYDGLYDPCSCEAGTMCGDVESFEELLVTYAEAARLNHQRTKIWVEKKMTKQTATIELNSRGGTFPCSESKDWVITESAISLTKTHLKVEGTDCQENDEEEKRSISPEDFERIRMSLKKDGIKLCENRDFITELLPLPLGGRIKTLKLEKANRKKKLHGVHDIEICGDLDSLESKIEAVYSAAIATTDRIQEELDAARDLWRSKDLTDYKFVSSLSCFCVKYVTLPREITVIKGEIKSISYADEVADEDPNEVSMLTVEQQFDKIQDAIDEDVFSVEAEYHETFGYATRIYIDYDERVADEEFSMSSKDVTPISEQCNKNYCVEGEYCCNKSCSTCTPDDGACTQQICVDDEEAEGI